MHGDTGILPVSQNQGIDPSPVTLNGCLTIANDGRALLKLFQSAKIYRLEAQPLLFSQNTGRFVHVTGKFGSVVAVEDNRVTSSLALPCQIRTTGTTPGAPQSNTDLLVAYREQGTRGAGMRTRGIGAAGDKVSGICSLADQVERSGKIPRRCAGRN